MASRSLLRKIPQVDRLLSSEPFRDLIEIHSRPAVGRALRGILAELRRHALNGGLVPEDLEVASIRQKVEARLAEDVVPYYRRVVNATGVVLHTGLGRATLPVEVTEAFAAGAAYPARLELDLDSGERGGRDEGCAVLLRELTGAEDATIVNNNAAATLLILSALARGKRVLLSRGEMIEIGGSFRIPEIIEEGGAVLVGVGTTNRTHLADYEKALDDETALILKVHTSNYRVEGFTAEVPIGDLAALGERHGIPVVHDLGSGCLIDLEAHGIWGEPHVRRSIEAGATLVCFSGDKLLGGPQSGIVAGRYDAVKRCRRHPLYRALRPGRLIYAALESLLRIYQEGDPAAVATIPALMRLCADPRELRERAARLQRLLEGIPGLAAAVVDDHSQAGSGALPTKELPTSAVRVVPAEGTVTQWARRLRLGHPPVVARVKGDALLLDTRTLDNDDLTLIGSRLREIAAEDR